MCSFGSKPRAPTPPKQYAAQKAPTRAQARSAGKRIKDRLASRPQTLLAGRFGVGAVDEDGKATVLGG